MTGYIPRNVQLGDKLRLAPYALDKQYSGDPHALTGEVVYIHPERRYATVRFPLKGLEVFGHWVDKSFSEAWPIMPDERRLAHKDPKPKVEPARPLPELLQERDWTGMTQGQIAKELGVGQMSVNSAITALKRKGIEVKYAKGLTFTQAAEERRRQRENV